MAAIVVITVATVDLGGADVSVKVAAPGTVVVAGVDINARGVVSDTLAVEVVVVAYQSLLKRKKSGGMIELNPVCLPYYWQHLVVADVAAWVLNKLVRRLLSEPFFPKNLFN